MEDLAVEDLTVRDTEVGNSDLANVIGERLMVMVV